MTGDPERIEEVVGRVDSLVIPIEQVSKNKIINDTVASMYEHN